METDVQKTVVEETVATQDFKGYTLHEIRYYRALAALQREFAKEKLVAQALRMRRRGIMGSGSNRGVMAKAGGIASKLFGGMNYVDYAMMGFSAFSTIRKIFKFFRK